MLHIDLVNYWCNVSNVCIAVLKDMNSYYHQCLSVCKYLHQKGMMPQNPELGPHAASISADKLIYTHAIEMVSVTDRL